VSRVESLQTAAAGSQETCLLTKLVAVLRGVGTVKLGTQQPSDIAARRARIWFRSPESTSCIVQTAKELSGGKALPK
jgi:hypothetical protein